MSIESILDNAYKGAFDAMDAARNAVKLAEPAPSASIDTAKPAPMDRMDERCEKCPLQAACSLEPNRPPCAAKLAEPASSVSIDTQSAAIAQIAADIESMVEQWRDALGKNDLARLANVARQLRALQPLFKVEDVEPILSNMQQLRAEVAGLESRLRVIGCAEVADTEELCSIRERMRQLSAD
jgi:hypothetical protein